jgi:hypothetical protein
VRTFLLSPARIGGARSKILFRPEANFDLALRLRQGQATVGEVYAFISNLYFRGKLAYVNAFGPALVIVPGHGLLPPGTVLTHSEFLATGEIPVEEDNDAFQQPLLRDARQLNQTAGPDAQCILLGSVATPKYTASLLKVFGERLLFPSEFLGLGDMSRGSLMLRAVTSNAELAYRSVAAARAPR